VFVCFGNDFSVLDRMLYEGIIIGRAIFLPIKVYDSFYLELDFRSIFISNNYKKNNMRFRYFTCIALMLVFVCSSQSKSFAQGQKIKLNGIWQVEEGSLSQMPETFNHECVVPGFLDMATPSFEKVGEFLKLNEKEKTIPAKDSLREAFWYKTTFSIDQELTDFAQLKIYKAKYGVKVWLNGYEVGEHLFNFSPGYFDLSKAIKGNNQTNELIVRVGSSTEGFGINAISGLDYEKLKYLPGIYDDVELCLSASPRIVKVQIVPDIDKGIARAVVTVKNETDRKQSTALKSTVKSYDKDEVKGTAKLKKVVLMPGETKELTIDVTIADCQFWSPENPNLYNMVLETSGDKSTTRFGMRKFEMQVGSNLPYLNNSIYYLRGTNICFFRMVEDHQREDKPWDEVWVRKLFKQFKSMNWNSCRICIGFPPEFWYRIADEEGVIIQDEYPIWTFNLPLGHSKEQLIKEYSSWMAEHWNYPSVCIWDAQNESPEKGNEQIKEAVHEVRKLDLSNRPWNLGWSKKDHSTDAWEEHPYLFARVFMSGVNMSHSGFTLADLNKEDPKTILSGKFGNPLCLNEYGWMWLTREGKPTFLTYKGYNENFPEATAQDRFEFYAYTLASLTEFWRTQRPAVLHHFCGLGHSYDNCYTSDNFTDLESLNFESHFEKYVKPAFNPLGICVFDWRERFLSIKKSGYEIPVVLVNDYTRDQKLEVSFKLINEEGTVLIEKKQRYTIAAGGKNIEYYNIKFPKRAGKCLIIAEFTDPVSGDTVQSVRKTFVR